MLTGLAFAAPITAFAATQENDSAFASLMRFGILPMFLFSGTFFPIDQLPSGAPGGGHGHAALARRRAVPAASASATPARSARSATSLYLLAWAAAGTIVARWTFTRRLVV